MKNIKNYIAAIGLVALPFLGYWVGFRTANGEALHFVMSIVGMAWLLAFWAATMGSLGLAIELSIKKEKQLARQAAIVAVAWFLVVLLLSRSA